MKNIHLSHYSKEVVSKFHFEEEGADTVCRKKDEM